MHKTSVSVNINNKMTLAKKKYFINAGIHNAAKTQDTYKTFCYEEKLSNI